MADEVLGVETAAPAAEAQPEVETSAQVSDESPKVDRKVYEKVREDMLAYKAEKKAKDSELEALRAEIEALKAAKAEPVDDFEMGDELTKAKVEVLMLLNTDPFVKDNLSLIQEKMTENPKLTAQAAVRELKAEFFDRMQKEVAKAAPEVPPKSISPKGNSAPSKTDVIKDALEGNLDGADPRQLEAYKATLARLK